jgi:hypothetical protein
LLTCENFATNGLIQGCETQTPQNLATQQNSTNRRKKTKNTGNFVQKK